jgi:TetR/AcrR family transcriptional regulator, cholesterol catabolism regulator
MSNETDNQNGKFELMLEQIKDLFFEFGIKNLNMDEISHKLGISKKTLYRFVKSKEDLLARLFEYDQVKWVESMSLLTAQNYNAIETLFKVSLMVYEEMKRFNPMILFELRKYYEPVYNEFNAKKSAIISRSMTANLKKGITEGLYREDINNEAVVAIYMSYLVEIHNNPEMCKIANVTFDELFRVMFENHIRAISTPQGVAYFEKRKKEIIESLNNNIN